jgi:WD40 repeat protein
MRSDYTTKFVDIEFVNVEDESPDIYQLLRTQMTRKQRWAKKLLSGSFSDVINLWDLSTYTHERTISGHKNDVTVVLRLSDGFIASGSRDDRLMTWDPKTFECQNVFTGHENSIYAVVELPDKRIVTAGYDQRLIIWTRTGINDVVLTGHSSRVNCLLVLQNGNIVSGDANGNIFVWNLQTNKEIASFNREGETMALLQLKDGSFVSANSSIFLFNSNTFQEEKQVHTEGRVMSMLDMGDGRIVTGHADNSLRVWQGRFSSSYVIPAVSSRVGYLNIGINGMVRIGGDVIATAGFDGWITIWNIKTKEVIMDIKENEREEKVFSVSVFE